MAWTSLEVAAKAVSSAAGRSADFMPHGYCYLWNPWIVWVHVISDSLIAISYYCIPLALVYVIRRRGDLPFSWIFWMFGAFVFSCGTTHLMEVWNVWHASYLLAGLLKALTALISVVTAVMLFPLVPRAVALPGPLQLRTLNHELRRQVSERERAEQELRETLAVKEQTLAELADNKSVVKELRLAQTALQESLAAREQALRELADHKFALDQHAEVSTADVEGRITYVNDRFCELTKYSREELIGQNHRIINSAYHHKEFFRQLYGTIGRGNVWYGEIRNRAKDGTLFWSHTTVVPFLAPDGRPRQYMAIRANITERKLAEEKAAHLAAIVDSSDDAIISKTLEGTITAWNRGAEKIFGYSAAEAMGKPMLMLLPSEIAGEEQDILVRIGRGESVEHFETVRIRKDRRRIDVSVTISPIRDESGAIVGASRVARDISERKQVERKLLDQREELSAQAVELARSRQELEKLNQELEKRVAQRTAELETANRELEAFTYTVSHDLRAPLRHIGGFSRILLEDFGPKIPAEAVDHLKRVEDGVRRMGLLVDELLNLARVGRHAVKVQFTSLNFIVEEVVSLLQPEITGRAITWKIADLPTAKCDPILIKQVFQNLLANALKFTRPRERTVIEISHRRGDGELIISVCDNGVGFNMKYMDKLFGVFQRLHRVEDFEGTGIGLATVQRIVHKHGGRVWAESEIDKGATFYFTLAVAESTAAAPVGLAQMTTALKDGSTTAESINKSAAAGGQV